MCSRLTQLSVCCVWGLKVAELDWKAVKRRAESKVSLFLTGKSSTLFSKPLGLWPKATLLLWRQGQRGGQNLFSQYNPAKEIFLSLWLKKKKAEG